MPNLPKKLPYSTGPDSQNYYATPGSGNVNKSIIATTLVITALGVVRAWTAKPPQGITRVVIGGYILMFLLSVLDLFGGGLGELATMLARLALVAVLLLEGVPILQQFIVLNGGSTAPAILPQQPKKPS
jgi:hypothetical protein